MSNTAYFLWVGGTLPDIARVSVLSAAEAGFDTVLFTDRGQEITHPALRVADWREINLPWSPDEVRLRGRETPYFAGFADLFRYALLASNDGWWIDCDTIILKAVDDFSDLLAGDGVVLGKERGETINNAVIGSRSKETMNVIYREAEPHYPNFVEWGVTGPKLMTKMIAGGRIQCKLCTPEVFYPIHHSEIFRIYMPEERERLLAEETNWYCLSLWSEVLSRGGLKHLEPPQDSYLATLLQRMPNLGGIEGDGAAMAQYLADNMRRLDDLDSGRFALRTLTRKAKTWLGRRRA